MILLATCETALDVLRAADIHSDRELMAELELASERTRRALET